MSSGIRLLISLVVLCAVSFFVFAGVDSVTTAYVMPLDYELSGKLMLFAAGAVAFALTDTFHIVAWRKYSETFKLKKTVRHLRNLLKECQSQLRHREIYASAVGRILYNASVILAGKTKFTIGSSVHKTTGYMFVGRVVSVFMKRDGNIRYVVEQDDTGLLHIFNEDSLGYGDGLHVPVTAEGN